MFHEHGIERQDAVLVVNLGKVAAHGRRKAAGRRTVGRCAGSGIGGAFIAEGVAVSAAGPAVAEIHVVGNNLRAAALIAVSVLPVTDLQAALYHGHAALGKVLGNELSRCAPRHHINEIRFLLAGLGLEIPIHRQRETGDRSPRLRAAQLGDHGSGGP